MLVVYLGMDCYFLYFYFGNRKDERDFDVRVREVVIESEGVVVGVLECYGFYCYFFVFCWNDFLFLRLVFQE